MIVSAASIVTVNEANEVVSPGWLRIVDGAITEVSARPLSSAAGEESVDASDLVVIPGLVNAHTHLFQTLIRGLYDHLPFTSWLRSIYHCQRALDEHHSRLAAFLGGLESMRSGVTTVLDHQFLNKRNELAMAAVEGIRTAGLRTVVARTIMDLGKLAPRTALESREEGLAAVRELNAKYRDDRAVTVMTGANTPGVSASGELSVAMREFSETTGIGRSSHVAESRDVLAAVHRQTGFDGVVTWLDAIGALGTGLMAAHSVHIAPQEIETMARHATSVVHNPVSNMFLGDGIAPVPEFLEAGVNVALGTDGAASNNSQNMFEVMKTAALLQRLRIGRSDALTPKTVLRMATINGARALGLADEIGSIEPGKLADIVFLDLRDLPATVGSHDLFSTIVFCAGPPNVKTVMVDGATIFADASASLVPESALLAEAADAAADLRARLAEA